MTERLNNEQIAQRIINTNSNIKSYLNLAPGLKLKPPQPNTLNAYNNTSLSKAFLPRPPLRP